MTENQTAICCDCGNYINHKPRYTSEDFERRSPYCLSCYDEFVEEEEGEEPLKTYTFLTGEMVEVFARNLEEAEIKLSNLDYKFGETYSELRHVGNAPEVN